MIQLEELKFKIADQEDCQTLFEWRNNPDVYKNFFHAEPVSPQGHKEWFARKLCDSRMSIYIAQKDNEKIGVIRFEERHGQVFVSITIAPLFWGKGIGRAVICGGTEKFLKENKGKPIVIAEIQKNNIASQKAFAYAGYILKEDKGEIVVYQFNKN